MATLNITDAGAQTIIQIINGQPKNVTTGGALDLPCSLVKPNTNGDYVGTVATLTIENTVTYNINDEVVFKLAQITAIIPTA